MDKDQYLEGMLERTSLFYPREMVEKVRNTVVSIAGLGGVGAITAELLARWGIKRFRLLDKDRYDLSNLNRQLFATSKTLGLYKVDVSIARIKEINPSAEIELAIKDRVDNQNVQAFTKDAGIIIQTADSPSCQLFYRAARKYRIPIVNGYSTIIGCRIQTYDYRQDSWAYRLEEHRDRIKNRGRKDLTEMSREELDSFDQQIMHPAMPTMNFVTNIAGALIVSEAIKLLTDTGKVCKYPNAFDLDLYHHTAKVINLYSPFRMETIRKILNRNKGKETFSDYIAQQKTSIGLPPS
jgi:molybdopterin/thiamine biosynthesis adenylyltransferase